MMDDAKRTDRTRDLIGSIITKRETIGNIVRDAYDRGYHDAREEYYNDEKEITTKLVNGDRYCGWCGRLFNTLEQNSFNYCPMCGKRIIKAKESRE